MMLSYLKILRPSIIFLTAFAVLAGALTVGYYQFSQIVIVITVACLIAGAGNVTNDYFDYRIDKINKPGRVIPSGKLKRKNAYYFALALYIIADALAMIFLNPYMILLAFFNTFVAFFYAWKLKKTIFGHFVDSWLASSTFLFGGLLASLNATVVLLFSMSYLANLGREIAKGIEDMEGDRKIGAKTLEVITGKIFAAWVAISFIIFSIIISFIPYISGLLSAYYLILVVISDLMFLFSCFILMPNPTRSQKIMKIAMFVAIIAFLVGAF